MRGKHVMERVTQTALRSGEPILKEPLLELFGDHRVLIEQHKGIDQYSSDVIDVKAKFGSICIYGSDLVICCMSAEQLIITGKIDTIKLLKESKR